MHQSMMPYSEYVIRSAPPLGRRLKPCSGASCIPCNELGPNPTNPTENAPASRATAWANTPRGQLGVRRPGPHGPALCDARRAGDGHGNFGSIDGDPRPPCAPYRSPMTPGAGTAAGHRKDTVGFHLNPDDTQKEPDPLPAPSQPAGKRRQRHRGGPGHQHSPQPGKPSMRSSPRSTSPGSPPGWRSCRPRLPHRGIPADDEEIRAAYETGRQAAPQGQGPHRAAGQGAP